MDILTGIVGGLMEVYPAGRNTWQKVLFLVLISGLIFAAIHKWSTMVRVVLQLGLFIYVVWRKRGELFKSLVKMPLLPVTVYVLFVGLTVPFSVDAFESIQSWVRLLEMYMIAVSIYHLMETSSAVCTGLFYIMVAFGIAYIVDIQCYLRRLGDEWVWGQIWDNPINFDHHNTYSAICIALLPISATFILVGRQLWMRIVVAVVFLMGLFLIHILQSRTTQVSLVFIMFVTGFLLSTVRRKIIYIALAAFVVFAAAINIKYINPRWLDASVRTGLGRTENWKNALTLIKERPLIGYGYGRKIYRDVYFERFGELVFNGHRFRIPHAHSGYLDRLFASGAVGLLLFLWIAVTAFAGLFREIIHRSEDWIVARAILLSLAGTFFYFLADIHDGVQWALMWVFLALAMRLSRMCARNPSVCSEG